MKYARSMALIRGVVLRSRAGRTRRVCAGKGAREQVPDVGRLQRMVSHGDDQDDQDDHLIDIRRIDDEQGWGFVACCDIDEGQALVSVPLSQTITGLDDPGMALPWSLQMVEQLLVRKYEDSAEPWMDSLPVHVDLPFLYWHDDDIARLGDPAFIREIVSLRAFYRSSDVRAYFSEYDWEDVMWGVAMVHSRSFVYSEGKHLFSPLIDMANHDDVPNACVRLVFSPDLCQGQVATDEIAPPRPIVDSAEPCGVFELRATRAIKAGEQVSISYGAQPNDVLLLYFGFALPCNEHDLVTVTLEDLDVVKGFAEPSDPSEPSEPGNDRFFITKQGVDPRLLERVASPSALADLCRWKLDQLLDVERKEHEGLAPPRKEDCEADRRRTASCYRKSKRALLEHAVKSLTA